MNFSPITLVNAYLKKVTRKQIFSGPFEGMYYIGESVGSSYFPKILGTYEKELHSVLDTNKSVKFEKIIVIGAGEGYYAAGLAKKWKRPVLAFEENERGRELLTRLALINRVSVFVKGRFEKNYNTHSKKDFILIDIEGSEKDIMDEERFQNWKHCVLMVEVHSIEIKEELTEKGKYSHHSFFIPIQARTMQDFPFKPPFPRLLRRWWWASIQEWRSDSIGWLIFEPKK